MSRRELSRSSKGLWQRIVAYVQSTLPRQARVTRTEGRGVWVKFLGDTSDDPESKFVSTVAGVPIATMGWVFSLGGKKGLFVATGIPYVTHLAVRGPNISNTTEISDLNWITVGTRQVQPGKYAFSVAATVPIRRSVSTGSIYVAIGLSGVRSVEYGAGLSGTGIAANTYFPFGVALTGDLTTETGDIEFEIGFRGASTAGQTRIAQAVMSATLTRIG